MVPGVTLLALSLGIGGYYVQNRQEVARQAEQQQVEDANKQDKATDTVKQEEPVDKSTDNPDQGVSSDVSDHQANQVSIDVVATNESDGVKVEASLATNEPGMCVISIQHEEVLARTEVEASEGKCFATLDKPGEGDGWAVTVSYSSQSSGAKGTGATTIDL